MSLYTTSTISVSRKEKLDCMDIAKKMSKLGIMTSITSNISTQPEIEYGCRLTQSVTKKDEIITIWDILKKNYNFTCAHLKIENGFQGCIKDFIRPNECNKEKND